jgi:hypothetical protein
MAFDLSDNLILSAVRLYDAGLEHLCGIKIASGDASCRTGLMKAQSVRS